MFSFPCRPFHLWNLLLRMIGSLWPSWGPLSAPLWYQKGIYAKSWKFTQQNVGDAEAPTVEKWQWVAPVKEWSDALQQYFPLFVLCMVQLFKIPQVVTFFALQVDVSWSVNGVPKGIIKQSLGHAPIMVKSKLCNLCGLSPKALIEHHEEEEVIVNFVGFSFLLI